LPEKRITDEYLSDLNMLLQEDEGAEVSFTEMEFSEKRTTNSISKKFLYTFLHNALFKELVDVPGSVQRISGKRLF
jgi:hypothetical protein